MLGMNHILKAREIGELGLQRQGVIASLDCLSSIGAGVNSSRLPLLDTILNSKDFTIDKDSKINEQFKDFVKEVVFNHIQNNLSSSIFEDELSSIDSTITEAKDFIKDYLISVNKNKVFEILAQSVKDYFYDTTDKSLSQIIDSKVIELDDNKKVNDKRMQILESILNTKNFNIDSNAKINEQFKAFVKELIITRIQNNMSSHIFEEELASIDNTIAEARGLVKDWLLSVHKEKAFEVLIQSVKDYYYDTTDSKSLSQIINSKIIELNSANKKENDEITNIVKKSIIAGLDDSIISQITRIDVSEVEKIRKNNEV